MNGRGWWLVAALAFVPAHGCGPRGIEREVQAYLEGAAECLDDTKAATVYQMVADEATRTNWWQTIERSDCWDREGLSAEAQALGSAAVTLLDIRVRNATRVGAVEVVERLSDGNGNLNISRVEAEELVEVYLAHLRMRRTAAEVLGGEQ